eukprot:6210464-Pleurochrysis_carterae.AAC.1
MLRLSVWRMLETLLQPNRIDSRGDSFVGCASASLKAHSRLYRQTIFAQGFSSAATHLLRASNKGPPFEFEARS